MPILTYFNRILLNYKKPNCFYLLYNLERENKVLLLMINDDDDDDEDEEYCYFAAERKLELYSSKWLRSKRINN